MTDSINPNIPKIFICNNCDYNTCNKKDYNKHLSTNKHKLLMNTDNKIPNIPIKYYKCLCGKIYKHSQSLYTHRKKCNYKESENKTIISLEENKECKEDYKELVMKLIVENQSIIKDNQEIKSIMINNNKENQELRKQITDMIPLIGNNNNSHNTVNNKQKFNINVF